MKLIKFRNPERKITFTGIVCKRREKWEGLIPKRMASMVNIIYEKTNGNLGPCHGFYMACQPEYLILLFESHDIQTTLAHESVHVMHNVIWDQGDKVAHDGDEGYSLLFDFIYEQFMKRLRRDYGLKTKTWFEPNERQKKNEIK